MNLKSFAEQWFGARHITVSLGRVESGKDGAGVFEDCWFDCDISTVCDMLDDWRETLGLGPMIRPDVIQDVGMVAEAIRVRRRRVVTHDAS
jgi:hypothetical protein